MTASMEDPGPPSAGRGTVNLFVAASPFHILCARLVRDRFCPGEEGHLVVNRPFLLPMASPGGWDSVTLLPWPRHHPLPGPLGRLRRLRENVRAVTELARGAGEIRLHAPVIDTEATNYFIEALRRLVPPGRFSVRLLPDGTLNLRRWPMPRYKVAAQHLRAVRSLVDPSLRYHRFRGCRTGADAPVVDRIYTLPGFPHEYDPARVVELPPFPGGVSGGGGEGKALVLGQPLVGHGHMGREDMDAVCREVAAFLREAGMREVWYKKHPRDAARELSDPSYRELETDEPLEGYLAGHPFGMVVGVRSTALVTARMILGDRCRILSFGLDRFRWEDGREREMLLALYRKLRIGLVGIDADGAGEGGA